MATIAGVREILSVPRFVNLMDRLEPLRYFLDSGTWTITPLSIFFLRRILSIFSAI